MKASDLLVQCLENEGIEYIFGVPGEENADFMLSLETSETIRFILTRQEQGAAFMARGAVDLDEAYCLFTIGLQARDLVACTIDADAADLVITLGYDMVEYHPRLWNPNADKRIIHIDFLPAEIDENYPYEVEVVGDLAHALWMRNERVDAFQRGGGKFGFDLSRQAAVRGNMRADFAEYKDDDTEGTIKPQKVI